MSKPPRFKDRKKLTLQGEADHIADAHAYAADKAPSLSALFWSLFLPRIAKDKLKRPQAYAADATPEGASK